ncbi:MAG TPA: radical SAM protein [Planctomycetota bacterium]|nr:radical SAM protein [Planctomycetota bacterium]
MASTKPLRCADQALVGLAGNHQVIESVQEWAYANCVPLNAGLELTLKCNIRCLHCYNFDRDVPREPGAPELSPEEILRVMTELREAGCLFLHMTGGEVFVHPRLFEFLDHARRLHLSIQLLSNGTLVRPEIARRLAGYENLLGTSLSLYGATPAVHDSITQVAGSFERTWEGALRLRENGIAVRVKYVVMKQNVHEVDGMLALARERGFPYLIDMTITGRHDKTQGSLATRIDPLEVESLFRGPLREHRPKGAHEVTEEDFPCNCARGNCAVSSTGEVYPCISVPWSAGNVREKPFAEIWRDSPVFRRIRELRLADYPHCAPCDLKRWCSRQRGAAYLASGEYTGIDPWICEAAEATRKASAPAP